MNGKWTCVDVTLRVDETHDLARATHIEPVKLLSETSEVKEGVTGENVAMGEEPLVELSLLVWSDLEVVPGDGTSARRSQAG